MLTEPQDPNFRCGPKNRGRSHGLEDYLSKILNSDDHKWYLGKMDASEKARRKKAAEEFEERYK